MRKFNDAQPSELQLDLLLILFEGSRASRDLVSAIGELRQRTVPIATFYRQLQRALDLGWVTTVDASTPDQAGRGRPERTYGITELGTGLLRAGMGQHERRVRLGRALGLLPESTS